MPIEFERSVEKARLKSPLEGFETVTKTVEHRTDPLTGRTARIVPEVFPDSEDDIDLDAVVGDGDGCFFCPESVADATPEYPDSIGGGRGRKGEATSFPNLFPYARHSNVVVLTAEHFRPIDELGADRLADGLACGLEYLASVARADDPEFASINMNLLRSSGSSVFHPHMQVIAGDHGTNRQARVARREREYYEEHEHRYYRDLLDLERSGDRYIGRTGGVEWLAPFAPLGQFHVVGVPGTADDGLIAPESDLVGDLAGGIDAVLARYADRGLNAFNFGLRFATEGRGSTPVVDIVARAPFEKHYVNDTFYAQTIHHEGVVDVAPEAYASAIADAFE